MKKITSKRTPTFYSGLLVVGITLAAVVFILSLLFMNYRFAVDLRGTNLKNMQAETEKRSVSAGFFFADRRDDLVNLALSREISVFFENKALGMSMEYGLKFSLFPIQKRFLDLVNRKKLGGDPVYSRIVLIEKNGTILVDTAPAADHIVRRERLKEFLIPYYPDGAILLTDGGEEIVISHSYFFKDRYAGQIIAWIQPQTVYKNVLGEGGSPHVTNTLISDDEKTLQSVGAPLPPHISSLPAMAALTPGEPFEFRDQNGEKQSWIALKLPVDGTPLHLLRVIAASHVVGKLTPAYLLSTMGVIAFMLLCGAAFTIIINTQAKKTVRESEEKFRAFFETSRDCVFITSKDGRVIDFNDAAMCFFGYESRDEMRKVRIQDLYEDEQDRRMHTQIIEQQGFCQDYPVNLKKKDGSIINTLITSVLKKDKNGKVVGYQGTIKDVTEGKQAEEERIRLSTAIEQTAEGIAISDKDWIIRYVNPAFERISGYGKSEIVGQHPRILKSGRHDKVFYSIIRDTLSRGEVWSGRITNKKKDGTFYEAEITASPVHDNTGAVINYVGIHRDITQEVKLQGLLRQAQKMEAIGTLAGGIAHDFNNILGAMVGYTEIAQLHATTEKQKYYLDQILVASNRAKNLVNQILAFSRQKEQERKPVLVAPIVKEGIKLLRSSLPATITITQSITTPSTTVIADPTQIHQVVMNLCTNASHAMRETGGKLNITLDHEKIDSGNTPHPLGLAAGDYARLTVSDTGYGIDKSIMDRIFDPFFTTKGPGEGTGLGLSVVYGIVKNYDGAIDVVSEPGKGTIVSVYFPLAETKEIMLEREPEIIPHGSERILFVDDEAVLVEVGTTMLTSLGYHVTARTSSIEALEAFRARPYGFDLMITDMAMPNMRGDHLAREMIKIRPDIPIILCTGFSEMMTEEKAKNIGIRQFIMKPLFKNHLAKVIREVL